MSSRAARACTDRTPYFTGLPKQPSLLTLILWSCAYEKPDMQSMSGSGGRWWIRTTEVTDNRFTVCPLWPLGKPPLFTCAIKADGAGGRIRTPDLLITNQLLYRLSYTSIPVARKLFYHTMPVFASPFFIFFAPDFQAWMRPYAKRKKARVPAWDKPAARRQWSYPAG